MNPVSIDVDPFPGSAAGWMKPHARARSRWLAAERPWPGSSRGRSPGLHGSPAAKEE